MGLAASLTTTVTASSAKQEEHGNTEGNASAKDLISGHTQGISIPCFPSESCSLMAAATSMSWSRLGAALEPSQSNLVDVLHECSVP